MTIKDLIEIKDQIYDNMEEKINTSSITFKSKYDDFIIETERPIDYGSALNNGYYKCYLLYDENNYLKVENSDSIEYILICHKYTAEWSNCFAIVNNDRTQIQLSAIKEYIAAYTAISIVYRHPNFTRFKDWNKKHVVDIEVTEDSQKYINVINNIIKDLEIEETILEWRMGYVKFKDYVERKLQGEITREILNQIELLPSVNAVLADYSIVVNNSRNLKDFMFNFYHQPSQDFRNFFEALKNVGDYISKALYDQNKDIIEFVNNKYTQEHYPILIYQLENIEINYLDSIGLSKQ